MGGYGRFMKNLCEVVHTSLLLFGNQECAAFSVILKRASLGSSGVQKNGLRLLRLYPDGLVRPQVRRVRDLPCGDTRIFLELEVRGIDCRHCGKVKRERLDLLGDNPLYTTRFAYYVGRRCRSATIKDVAAELKLDWHTVKALDQQYMEAQLKRA